MMMMIIDRMSRPLGHSLLIDRMSHPLGHSLLLIYRMSRPLGQFQLDDCVLTPDSYAMPELIDTDVQDNETVQLPVTR